MKTQVYEEKSILVRACAHALFFTYKSFSSVPANAVSAFS